MSISDSIQNLQNYGNNRKNGYMDAAFLGIVMQKKRLGLPLNQEEQAFLDNANSNPTIQKKP